MTIKSIRLEHRNNLARDYINGLLPQFFTYNPFESMNKRVDHLQSRQFPREELVSILMGMNKNWDASEKTLQQIERLQRDDSVVVVGGQQAGLLTGPLYTIHKIISIIKYAREQEEKLNIPVIPLFWIAGEDHDFDEINHVYTTTNHQLNKRIIGQEEWRKKPVAHIPLDKVKTEQWIKQVFHDLIETEYTRELTETIFKHVQYSETFVDFFARLILQLFKNEGIVLIDSANEQLRTLESPYFEKLIMKQIEITKSVHHTAQNIHYAGYNVQVDVSENDANLFYHDEYGERILLVKEGSHWVGKQQEVSLTVDELLFIARNEPERLSNNVISRPLMQEAILPTLAFIAGDGEISYWALLKDAFKAFDSNMEMPPVVPRLSLTFITERIDKLINNRNLDTTYIVNHGCKNLSVNWLATQQSPPIQMIFDEVEGSIVEAHKPIQQLSESIGPDLGAEAKRNLQNILKELAYLKQRTMNQLEQKYALTLDQFKEINLSLRPKHELQERILNIVSILNECGPMFLSELLKLDFSFKEDHYLVYLHKLKQ